MQGHIARLIQRETRTQRHKTAVRAERTRNGRRCAVGRLRWAAAAYWGLAAAHEAMHGNGTLAAIELRWIAACCALRWLRLHNVRARDMRAEEIVR
jgi:hypothetical protein